MKFATLLVPNFFLQVVLRNEPKLLTGPVAVLDELDPKAVILELNELATAAGVNRAMTASQGLARCPELVIKARRRAEERVAQEILLQHAFMLSPNVEATGEGICTVQFASDRDLPRRLEQVCVLLAGLKIGARAGLASTPDISFLAAHLAEPVLCVEEEREFLTPLPLGTLLLG